MVGVGPRDPCCVRRPPGAGGRRVVTDRVGDWVELVHDRYPPAHAAGWDNVGLQVGDPDWPVERVLIALDVTSDVIGEAASAVAADRSDSPVDTSGAASGDTAEDGTASTLVLAHHPLLFDPIERLTPDSASGKIALAAAQARVAVLAAHTNLDVAVDGAGTSDPVMRVLGIDDARPLTSETREAGEVKLVTFVPHEHVDAVLDGLAAAGAGVIGDYERCSFRVEGTGTFRPNRAASPHTGEVEEDNEVAEARIEMVVPHHRLGAARRALDRAHPYEEVAVDIYPLVAGGRVGFGRVGNLSGPRRLADVADTIRGQLPAPHLRYAGDPDREVTRLACVGGAGAALIPAARAAGAEVLVTGDLKHHTVLDAREMGLALIDAGHHATEVAALPAWIDRLRTDASERGLTAEVVASRTSTAPWQEVT